MRAVDAIHGKKSSRDFNAEKSVADLLQQEQIKNSFQEAILFKAQELKQLKEEEEVKTMKKTIFFDPNLTLNDNKDWLKNTKTFYFEKRAQELSPLQKLVEITRYSKGLNKSQRKFLELQNALTPDTHIQENYS
jgi:hypothetical protein